MSRSSSAFMSVFLLFLAVPALPGYLYAGGFRQNPQISSVTPTNGVVGTQVTIAGSNFGSSPGTVTFRHICVPSFGPRGASVFVWEVVVARRVPGILPSPIGLPLASEHLKGGAFCKPTCQFWCGDSNDSGRLPRARRAAFRSFLVLQPSTITLSSEVTMSALGNRQPRAKTQAREASRHLDLAGACT